MSVIMETAIFDTDADEVVLCEGCGRPATDDNDPIEAYRPTCGRVLADPGALLHLDCTPNCLGACCE